MASVLGLFPDLESAVRAIDGLKAARFDAREIDVLSSIPLPPESLGLPETRTTGQVRGSVLMGGVGTLTGFLLAGGTAWLYPLPTGGKPIIAMPTSGVIMYEMTMLGAIWTAFFVALYRIWQQSRGRTAYDPRIANGAIGVTVTATPERLDEAAAALTGALEVKRWD